MDLGQRLKDKVAVITGGASGIGLATAKRMQAEGAIVVIGDVDAATGKSVANDMNVTFVQVDVADQVAVDHLFDTAFEVHGGVDIAFNNAGISPPEDDLIENTGVDAWDRVQDINLKSVFFCCKAALRHMVPA
ncbi:SDR family NAD(P)-dependent oxidoreductase, partial [Mycolicibacterium sp.]